MGFKQFLNEMPWFDQKIEIPCPYHKHSGGPIKGGDLKWLFDIATEHVKNGRYKDRLLQFHGIFGQMKGRVPMLCRADEKVFMFNTKDGKSFAPVEEDDVKFCKEWIDALMKADNNKQLGIKNPTILTVEEEK